MLTVEEYIEQEGGVCPFCGSGQLEGGTTDMGGLRATQNVWCNVCDREWFDEYRLVGFYAVAKRAKKKGKKDGD